MKRMLFIIIFSLFFITNALASDLKIFIRNQTNREIIPVLKWKSSVLCTNTFKNSIVIIGDKTQAVIAKPNCVGGTRVNGQPVTYQSSYAVKNRTGKLLTICTFRVEANSVTRPINPTWTKIKHRFLCVPINTTVKVSMVNVGTTVTFTVSGG